MINRHCDLRRHKNQTTNSTESLFTFQEIHVQINKCHANFQRLNMIYNPIDSESFYVFFKLLGWTSKQKNINFLITPGCLWLPGLLCSCPMVKLHFCNLFFCVGTIWKNFITYLSCLVSSLHAALLILLFYGFVSQWYWMLAKGQLMTALMLDWFLTRFHWLCNNQDDNLHQFSSTFLDN